MRRTVLPLLLLVAAVLLSAAPASAEFEQNGCRVTSEQGTQREYTCLYGPIDIGGYQVRQRDLGGPRVPKPDVDGFITHMSVNVTDPKTGAPVPIQRIMLHHIVFSTLGRQDGTCGSFTMLDSKTVLPGLAERFYGAGEERNVLILPPGYGYQVKANDDWLITWMLMNHRPTADRVNVEYRITHDTSPDVTPVTPYWLDVRNCLVDPVFSVPGGGRPGSTFSTSSTWTVPAGGRIVAGGGHVHGGAKDLVVSEPSCGNRTLFTSRPTWGLPSHPFYHVRPILHEPGPISMSGFNSQQGIPVAAGDRLKLTANYDDALPHTRVMGITMIYVAPDRTVTQPCGALPSDIQVLKTDQPGRTKPPRFIVPLTGLNAAGKAITISRPPGRIARISRNASVRVGDLFFSRPNLSVPEGATVRWRFTTATLHNVTLADGPRGFASVHLSGGRTFRHRFTVPGTYRLFCALHPVDMTEAVIVRARKRR